MVDTKYYCYLDSSFSVESTNLQLYSLKKAYEEWKFLSDNYKQDGDNTENLNERLVFIVSCLGLSLSQLLGQNAVIIKQKLDRPDALLAAFLNESNYERDKKNLLNRKFNTFIEYYDACRHFGRVDGEEQWKKINSLSFDLVESFIQTTLDIWNAVIGHHRSEHMEAENIKEILGEIL